MSPPPVGPPQTSSLPPGVAHSHSEAAQNIHTFAASPGIGIRAANLHAGAGFLISALNAYSAPMAKGDQMTKTTRRKNLTTRMFELDSV